MSLQLSLQQALHLTAAEAALAVTYFKESNYPKQTILLQQDAVCTHLYFLVSGHIRIFANCDGKEVTQWICTPNYFVTDLGAWLFANKTKWCLETLSDTTVYQIKLEDYNTLRTQITNWSDKERHFIGHCFELMEQRIYNFITLSSEERYTHFCQNLGYLFNEVPHHYIASILGITPETLSRIRRKQSRI